MQITLLPPLLPSEAVASVATTTVGPAPGTRLIATVLGPGLDGGTRLALGGQHLATADPLPYPAGARVHLAVVGEGRFTVVGADAPASQTPCVATPPVSPEGYGLAAAVLAANGGSDGPAAAAAALRWLPALVEAGLLSSELARTLTAGLTPLPVPTDPAFAAAFAEALAARLASGGLYLERRLAAWLRTPHAAGTAPAAGDDLRLGLAAATRALDDDVQGDWDAARQDLSRVQAALLAAQARTAAHLAGQGVVDVGLWLQVGQIDVPARMRVDRDGARHGQHDDEPTHRVRLDLTLDGLGPLQVRIGVHGTAVRAEIVVSDAGAADRIEAGLAELGQALEDAGFEQALTRVVVDPIAANATEPLPTVPPHAIVDALA